MNVEQARKLNEGVGFMSAIYEINDYLINNHSPRAQHELRKLRDHMDAIYRERYARVVRDLIGEPSYMKGVVVTATVMVSVPYEDDVADPIGMAESVATDAINNAKIHEAVGGDCVVHGCKSEIEEG